MQLRKDQKRNSLLCALALLTVWSLPAPAWHEDGHVGILIVPFSPGGKTDGVARILAPRLAGLTGAQVLVKNVAGAGGAVGANEVANSAAEDVLLVTSSAPITLAAALNSRLQYDPLVDLVAVTQIGTADLGIASGAGTGVTDLAGLTSAARARPGGASYALSGPLGTLQHLVGVAVAEAADVELQATSFPNAQDALVASIGGHVDFVVAPLQDLLPLESAGQVEILAKSGTKRSALAPNVPTLRELGVPFDVTEWYGVFAPASIDSAELERINKHFIEVIKMPEVANRLMEIGIEPTGMEYSSFAELQRADLEAIRPVVAAAGLQQAQ